MSIKLIQTFIFSTVKNKSLLTFCIAAQNSTAPSNTTTVIPPTTPTTATKATNATNAINAINATLATTPFYSTNQTETYNTTFSPSDNDNATSKLISAGEGAFPQSTVFFAFKTLF